MTEILFYHLTESKMQDALPPLVDKSLARGWLVTIQTPTPERRDWLDQHLWTFRDDSFLPHGTDAADYADRQPILITKDEGNANGSTVRFLVDGAPPGELSGYARVVFLFDGHDQSQLEEARSHWKRLKTEGHALTYWQQNNDGRWEKKA